MNNCVSNLFLFTAPSIPHIVFTTVYPIHSSTARCRRDTVSSLDIASTNKQNRAILCLNIKMLGYYTTLFSKSYVFNPAIYSTCVCHLFFVHLIYLFYQLHWSCILPSGLREMVLVSFLCMFICFFVSNILTWHHPIPCFSWPFMILTKPVYIELRQLDVLHFVIEECRHLANDCTAKCDSIGLKLFRYL